MGTPGFAVASLNALHEAGFAIAAVVTAPDRPAGRGREIRSSPVKERALELGLPILQPEKLKDPAFIASLRALDADLFVVVAFRMLPEMVWAMPRLGSLNLHASLLPSYRGAAPINWAIMHGEVETGISTFLIRAEIDTGDLLLQEKCPIGPDETAGELHDRLMLSGGRLVVRTVRELLNGTLASTPQRDVADRVAARDAPKLTPANCRIPWNRSAQQVHDHVRGLSPSPAAWTEMIRAGKPPMHFKVLRTRLAHERTTLDPGAIELRGSSLYVACADGLVEMLEVQPEGKRRMSARELFVRIARCVPLRVRTDRGTARIVDSTLAPERTLRSKLKPLLVAGFSRSYQQNP
ncbi:MAG: methionyl-tRNA formyltransferase [Flavobacteriales bacterium]|nr:methionyl-tRNA formyltransferase [Flavobacteriales bacterium]